MTETYMLQLLRRIGAPKEALPTLAEAERTLCRAGDRLTALEAAYFADPAEGNAVFEQLDVLAAEQGIPPETASFVLLCRCAEPLERLYREQGLSAGIFLTSMTDLRCKLLECRRVRGIWGTFVRGWFFRFYTPERFGLGRLQFEHVALQADSYTAAGRTLCRGDRVINVHIPSMGPLTAENRHDSYRRAWEFFRDEYPGGVVPFVCFSWLLDPYHEQYMHKDSHIRAFAADYELLWAKEEETFEDSWRVFGTEQPLPPEQLPRNTSLQRACADWLAAGGKTAEGYGIFLFDGQQYIHSDGVLL